MYIIVGLGNPKKEYENTRHNIGFDVIDVLAEQEKITVLEKKHKAIIGKGFVAGQKCILAKRLNRFHAELYLPLHTPLHFLHEHIPPPILILLR